MIAPTEWPRWLRDHEPVWVVGAAAGALDIASHVVPAVPDSWHPAVDVVLAVLTLLAQRKLAWSWNSVRRTLDANQGPTSAAAQALILPLPDGGHVRVVHHPVDPPTSSAPPA